ncbi:hypothetical protein WA1_07545 [Scytonema hofmannii PCC 7110]|uniref:Uncharacterized protein n=1 Tax=Scytonema hofmannii PCC 7110 TaxID=128403 RepID=A0A139WT94_9CYAN|nr:hypothetical protein [Scytonema hofmannii]KYC35658.1 hypothetical protein WA1_07545 [Scytonema hofmannii PCC 7110]
MTSSQPNNIHIEITTPSQTLFPCRVYPIPKNQPGVNTPIKLHMRIAHNTSNFLYLNPDQPFIPELLTLNGQIIQGHLVTEELITNTPPNIPIKGNQKKDFELWRIRPNGSTIFSWTAKLFWQNNSLKLKIPTVPDNKLVSPVNFESFWCFDALEAKNYQMRFILDIDSETTLSGKYNIIQEGTLQENHSGILSTQWLNIRLVQPLSTDEHTIEVNGITFKIEMPSSTFQITKSETLVNLGIYITNKTSMTFRFYQKASIEAILIGDDSKEINSQSDPPGRWRSKEPEYYSIKPGKSAFLNLESMLLWGYKEDLGTNIQETWFFDKNLTLRRQSSDNQRGFHLSPEVQIQLAIPNKTRHRFSGGNGFDYFSDLKVGATYQLQIIYCVPDQARNLESQVLEKVWTGWIAMPFVEFHLIKS